MKKEYLIRHPECFQGEKELRMNKTYFEGWYFKHADQDCSIAFIPGIHIEKEEKSAFIQVMTAQHSYYISYDIREFEFIEKPFEIRIGKNTFSMQKIHLEIADDQQNLHLFGEIAYSECQKIQSSIFAPNIMGPFSYLPFMECNHAVLSMNHKAKGTLRLNDRRIVLNEAAGYIEKDWGTSFPSSYLWCQGNDFDCRNTGFMISIAEIPFCPLKFTGLICALITEGKEFRFATYNGAKIIRLKIQPDEFSLVLKKGEYKLEIHASYKEGQCLMAPVRGKMERGIKESVTAVADVKLTKQGKVIFFKRSHNCGLEIVEKQ